MLRDVETPHSPRLRERYTNNYGSIAAVATLVAALFNRSIVGTFWVSFEPFKIGYIV